MSTFIFHSYLGRLLKAWAGFFDRRLFGAIVSGERGLCGGKCTCPVLLWPWEVSEAVVLPRVVSEDHSTLLVILRCHTLEEENF